MTAEQREQREGTRAAEFEVINELHEIATDVAERLGYPMNHLIDYDVIDGQAWCTTATIPQPMVEITRSAVRDGHSKYHGESEFQNKRLKLEDEEAHVFDQMLRGEILGNVLVVETPIPDAVRRNPGVVKGYRADLARSLVRIYYITDDGRARCRMFSIDQSDPDVLMHAARELNVPIDQWRGSEDMLGRRGIFSMSSVKDSDIADLASRVINQVDALLLSKTGHVSYAGSRFSNAEDALSMVKRNQHLLEECRQNLRIIKASGLSAEAKAERCNEEMKQTTSAIHASIDGHAVESSSDGIAGDYAARNNYEADCPTGPSALENALSHASKEVSMTCPQCGLTTVGDPCGFRIVCSQCDAEVRGGKLWNKGIGRTAAHARNAQKKLFGSDAIQPLHQKKRDHTNVSHAEITRQFGANAIIRTEFIIGGKDTLVVNKLTHQVYAKL